MCVVGWAAAQAHAGRFLHHHSHMTVAQKVRYFERSVAQDRRSIRWLRSRYAPRTLQRVDEISWSRHALRWHLALLRQYRSKLEPRYTDLGAWLCIHAGEGSWTSNTGNGYFGGLQMDYGFMRTYGPGLLAVKGTADRWTPAEQIMVARRARDSGRGYFPWPNTARACGLI